MFVPPASHRHVARMGGILSAGVRRRARRPSPRARVRLPLEALEDRCLLSIIEFPLPANAGSGPEGITLGPDRNLWFTMGSGIRRRYFRRQHRLHFSRRLYDVHHLDSHADHKLGEPREYRRGHGSGRSSTRRPSLSTGYLGLHARFWYGIGSWHGTGPFCDLHAERPYGLHDRHYINVDQRGISDEPKGSWSRSTWPRPPRGKVEVTVRGALRGQLTKSALSFTAIAR